MTKVRLGFLKGLLDALTFGAKKSPQRFARPTPHDPEAKQGPAKAEDRLGNACVQSNHIRSQPALKAR
jgi:hypothetical protein